jgi:hypothetical protein
MAFDITTARAEKKSSGFDIGSAKSENPLIDLQNLLARQSTGEQGLGEQIAQLRQSTGQVDPDTGQATGAQPTDISERGVLGSFAQGVEQGASDIGTGLINTFNEVRALLGDEEAEKLIGKISLANAMRQAETNAQTAQHPVARFGGEVVGSALALPLPLAQGSTKLATVGKAAGLGAIGGGLQAEGTEQDVGTGAAIGATIGAAIPVVGPKIAKLAKSAFGKTKAGSKIAVKGFQDLTDFTKTLITKEGRQDVAASVVNKMTNQEKKSVIAEMIRKGDPNTDAVTKALSESGELISNKAGKNAKKALGDDIEALKTISTIENMSNASKSQVRKMLNIVDRSRKETRFESLNRVENVVGDSIAQRAKHIARINKQEGKRIGAAADKLEGKKVDISESSQGFFAEMESLGVKFNDVEGRLKPDFSESTFVGGGQDTIEKVANFVKDGGLDGKKAHKIKQFIRRSVSFGSKAPTEPIEAESQRILKKLATGIGDKLGEQSKVYKKANARFSQTIDLKDAFNKLAGKDLNGKNIDLFSDTATSAIGNKARRLVSNATSKDPINELLLKADDTLNDLGVKFNDNVIDLNNVATRLKDIFKLEAPASFQGRLERSGANVAQGASASGQALGAAIDTVKAISRPDFDKKMKALRALSGDKPKLDFTISGGNKQRQDN